MEPEQNFTNEEFQQEPQTPIIETSSRTKNIIVALAIALVSGVCAFLIYFGYHYNQTKAPEEIVAITPEQEQSNLPADKVYVIPEHEWEGYWDGIIDPFSKLPLYSLTTCTDPSLSGDMECLEQMKVASYVLWGDYRGPNYALIQSSPFIIDNKPVYKAIKYGTSTSYGGGIVVVFGEEEFGPYDELKDIKYLGKYFSYVLRNSKGLSELYINGKKVYEYDGIIQTPDISFDGSKISFVLTHADWDEWDPKSWDSMPESHYVVTGPVLGPYTQAIPRFSRSPDISFSDNGKRVAYSGEQSELVVLESGLTVMEVLPNSIASKAGIQIGDRIMGFDTFDDYVAYNLLHTGKPTVYNVIRNGKEMKFTMTPDEKGFVGVAIPHTAAAGTYQKVAERLFVDDVLVAEGDSVLHLFCNDPNATSLILITKYNKKLIQIGNNRPSETYYEDATIPTCSDDGQMIAYSIKKSDGKWYLIENGNEKQLQGRPMREEYTPGTHILNYEISTAPETDSYATTFIPVINGKEYPEMSWGSGITLSKNGTMAILNNGTTTDTIMLGDRLIGSYPNVVGIRFYKNSDTLVYSIRKDDNSYEAETVFVGDKVFGPHDEVTGPIPIDDTTYWLWWKDGDTYTVHYDTI